jgi:O-antigen/teichoic acid export membrane protein
VGLLLNMSGHEKDTVVGSGIAVVVNLVLNLALIPAWGMTGAAAATTLSLVTWNLILIGRVRHRLGISSVAWPSSWKRQ